MIVLPVSLAILVVSSGLLGNEGFIWGPYPAWIYLSAASFYSVCLVAYGSFAPEKPGLWKIKSRAGIVFAVGGWVGSSLGIGMVRDLGHMPVALLPIGF